MTLKDKKLINSMIKALELFEKCLPKFSDDSWQELCEKICIDGEESPPTWNEISALKKRLEVIIDE